MSNQPTQLEQLCMNQATIIANLNNELRIARASEHKIANLWAQLRADRGKVLEVIKQVETLYPKYNRLALQDMTRQLGQHFNLDVDIDDNYQWKLAELCIRRKVVKPRRKPYAPV